MKNELYIYTGMWYHNHVGFIRHREYYMKKEKFKKWYIPQNMKIGRASTQDKNSRCYAQDVEVPDISFPVCRYKLQNWTSSTFFEKMTGFRPTNMVDKSMEINKVLTGNVFDLTNEPTDGFRVVDFSRYSLYETDGSSYSWSYRQDLGVILEDPRGFNIQISNTDFFELIIKHNVRISENGLLEGAKFLYAWPEDIHDYTKYENWRLVLDGSIPKEQIIHENDLIKEFQENPGVKSKDLVPGTVYDYNDKGHIKRYLYLGKNTRFKMSDIKNFVNHTFVSKLGDIIDSPSSYFNFSSSGNRHSNFYYGYYPTCNFPWKDSEWKSLKEKLESKVSENIFIDLTINSRDAYGYYLGRKNMTSVSRLLNKYPYTNDDSLDRYIDISILNDIKVIGGGKNIRGVSEDQTISKTVNSDVLITEHIREKLEKMKFPNHTSKDVKMAFNILMDNIEHTKKIMFDMFSTDDIGKEKFKNKLVEFDPRTYEDKIGWL